MQRKNKEKGAGVVLFRRLYGVEKVLVLLKNNGIFDIPKGHNDPADLDNFSTAQRECFEETQIFISPSSLLTQDFYKNSNMTIFCARTNQEPSLEKNPETGKAEHVDFYWLDPVIALEVLPVYLSSAVKWGLKYVDDT
jgi:8-oxo-dGTP pyrophosphatase MutT (NUDIX family)